MGICESNNKNQKQTYNKPTNNKLKPINQDASIASVNAPFNENNVEKIIKNSNTYELKNLIESGELDVNFRVTPNASLLLYSVIKQADVNIIQYLVSKGADVNEQEIETGNTAIYFASMELNEEVVDLLLENNANLDIRNRKDETIFEFLKNYYEKDDDEENQKTPEEMEQYRRVVYKLSTNKKKSSE